MDNKTKQALVTRFLNDTSIVYGLTYEQLAILSAEVGEMEIILDAISIKNWWKGGTQEH